MQRALRVSDPGPKLNEIAGVARSCADAFACVLTYRSDQAEEAVGSSHGDSAWEAAANTALAFLARRSEAENELKKRSEKGAAILVLAGAELAAATGARAGAGENVQALACAISEPPAEARIAIIAPGDRNGRELEAVAELACRAALSTIAAGAKDAAREFWRERAAAMAERHARQQAEFETDRRAREAMEAAAARAAGAKPRDRFAIFGQLVAGAGLFDQWTIAVQRERGLEVATAGPDAERTLPAKAWEAVRKSFEEQSTLALDRAPALARLQQRERGFGRSYLCVPFDKGAIALASRAPVSEAARARVVAAVQRFGPIVTSWVLEAELTRQRELVRRLGLRMFTAIDEERSRIARDLHDDQAQLLAAARIALEGRRDEARAIFQRLEQELRVKVRQLKPATLGASTLEDALRSQFKRLADAGIKGRLTGVPGVSRLSRPVQQLCYQVAREALSNVLRHSGATRVEIAISRSGADARISVTDNGRGIAPGASERGTGLAGLRERLELMGGALTIDSGPRATTLRADIPELV